MFKFDLNFMHTHLYVAHVITLTTHETQPNGMDMTHRLLHWITGLARLIYPGYSLVVFMLCLVQTK